MNFISETTPNRSSVIQRNGSFRVEKKFGTFTFRLSPQAMPRKFRKQSSGWKRQSTSGKKLRKWNTKRMPLKKSYGITAPVNLGNGMPFAVRNSFSFSRNIVLGTTLVCLWTMCSEATLSMTQTLLGLERNRSTLTK